MLSGEPSSFDPPALDGWLAYVHLEDLPGLSSITTVGRFTTVEEAQVAIRSTRSFEPPDGGGASTFPRSVFDVCKVLDDTGLTRAVRARRGA
jgi:hypothetical protein